MSGSSFDPDTLATLREVLESSVQMLPERLRTPATNVSLASHLLSAAAQGHRSRAALVEIGTKAATDYCNARSPL
jgi:hypothetical protein